MTTAANTRDMAMILLIHRFGGDIGVAFDDRVRKNDSYAVVRCTHVPRLLTSKGRRQRPVMETLLLRSTSAVGGGNARGVPDSVHVRDFYL